MSKKTFDELCASYLGENVPPTPAAPKLVTTPSPNQPAQPGQPTNNNQQNQNNSQINDDELMKLLQQKLQDEKFKQQLAQMLNPAQQPNATNQPA